MLEHFNFNIFMMKHKNAASQADDPKITYHTIQRPKGFTVDRAMKSLKKLADPARREEGDTVRREDDFLYLADQVDNVRGARQLRDRVIGALSARGLSRDEWGQRVIAVMNDTLELNGGEVKRGPKKSKESRVLRVKAEDVKAAEIARESQREVVADYREAATKAADEGNGQMVKDLQRDFLTLAQKESVTGERWVQEILGILRGSGAKEGQVRAIFGEPKKAAKGKSKRMQEKKAAQKKERSAFFHAA